MDPSTDPHKADAMASCTGSFWVNCGRRTEEPGAFQGTSVELASIRRRCVTGFHRDANPKPTSLAGSEGSLRRIIWSSGCGLCGDCKLISPVKKVLVKQVQKSPEKHKATQALKEDLEPKVNLCDVVLNSDASCHDCGFVLPGGFETKNVHCFKRDMRAAGLQLRPRCSGHHKHGMSRPKLQSDEVCQPGSQFENQQQEEYVERNVLTNHSARPLFKGWVNEATWPASTMTGKPSVEFDPPRACETIRTERDAGKINNSADLFKNCGTLKCTTDLETIKPNCLSNEEERWRTSNSLRPDLTYGTSNGASDTPQMYNMPEETTALCDDAPSSFTCQRIRVYVRKTNHSCARTCITWHNKRLILNGIIHLESSKNVLPQTATIPSALLTPTQPSPSSGRSDDVNGRIESRHLEDAEEEANEVQSQSEQLELEQTMNTDHSPDVAQSGSFPGSLDDDDDDGETVNGEGQPSSVSQPGSSSPERADGEGRPAESEAGLDTRLRVLDEFTAYQHDILLVDVNLDDSDLFGNLPQESLLKLGPNRLHQDPKTLPTYGASQTLKQSWTPVNINLRCGSPDNEESSSRPWRPKNASPKAKRVVFNQETHTQPMASFASRNHVIRGLQQRDEHIEVVNESHNPDPRLGSVRKAPLLPTTTKKTGPKLESYCWKFFSESQSCNYKMCRFLHAPMEGDEKFCVNTVASFTKNPMSLQKAGTVFISYYQNNPPGMFFSMPVFLSLIWALLRAGMMHDVLAVLSVSLAHKIVPTHEFLLALFTFVREKGCTRVVPHLMQLTYKMASEHSVLSVDCFEWVTNPEFQKLIRSRISAHQRLSASTDVPISDSLNLAHVIVEMELCAKQEEWRHLGEAFHSICTPCHHPNQLERISGHIAIALLSETKDKLSVPFAAFAETICHNEDPDSPLMSFIGRIGVTLLIRYHRTQQWAKGRKVVEVLSQSKINYSMQKGLFRKEDGRSRCHRITLAAELFILSGSLDGAVQTLRENEWFVSSSAWPCQTPDLESRSRMLTHLAEKASHRDTLEVLRNLPGIQEPNDQVDISKYTHLFNTHLQVCVDKLMLPIASDSVDFMLSRKVPIDGAVLQALLHKLGTQNHWLRARKVFRHSLTAGYYPSVSAPAGFMALIVPSRLGEVELALTFEMLITVNASLILPLSETAPRALSITLKRSQESESEYLSAGSRLLAAAHIPQPKLEVHYTPVNSSQEQVFMLSVASARHWLHGNQAWANEVWIH
ncbi:uncharacterized protein topaz1 isoform X2 [Festucalex cinctus]